MIRYLARTTPGAWAFVVLLMLSLINIAQRGSTWEGDVLLAASGMGIPYFVFLPVFAAIAAVDAARASSDGRQHLACLPRPWRTPYVTALAAAWIPVAVTQVVLGAVVLASVAPPQPSWADIGQAMLAVVVLDLLSLAGGAVGSVVGRSVGPMPGALVAGGTVFALCYTRMTGAGRFYALDFGGGTVSRIGTQYSTPYLLTQVLALCAVSVLLVLVPVRARGLRLVPTPLGAVSAVVAVVLVVYPIRGLPEARFYEDSTPPSACAGEILVCMHPESEGARPRYVPMIERLVEAARGAGYPAFVPDRVEQVAVTHIASGAPGRVFTFTVEPGEPQAVDLVIELLNPVHCTQLSSDEPPSEAFWMDLQRLAATWLAIADPDAAGPVTYGIEDFEPLSPEEALATIDRLHRCDFA